MNDKIKPEWVETAILAALNAGRVNVGLEPADSLVGFIGAEGWRAEMRTALAAVLPDIIRQAKAEAWEEGAWAAWEHSTSAVNGARYYWRHEGEPVNPYGADRIEQGGQP